MLIKKYRGQRRTYLLKFARIETAQSGAPVRSLNGKSLRVRVVLSCGQEVLLWMPTADVRARELDQVYIPGWLFRKINLGLKSDGFAGQMRTWA